MQMVTYCRLIKSETAWNLSGSDGSEWKEATEKRSIKEIYLMGLALDYCVKYSALDARHLGLNTNVIVDGCRGIELEQGDINLALAEMKRAGAVFVKSSDL